MYSVAVLIGSLRAQSLNRKLAESVGKLAEGRLEFRFIEIGDLPLYNDDLWAAVPPAVLKFKADVAACDAALFVTPEFNRGVPAALTNAFDWGSRPYGQGVWADKPAAIMGTSPGAISTAVAQSVFRNQMLVLGMAVMGQPELYVQSRPGLFDTGEITDEGFKALMDGFIDKYAAWIARVA